MNKNVGNLLVLLVLFITVPFFAQAEETQEYVWLIPPKYERGKGFSEGLWCVQKNDLWGYVDSADNVVIDFQYSDATIFKDGIAFVQVTDAYPEEWGVIDKQGQYLIESNLNLKVSSLYAGRFKSSNLILFQSKGKYGFVNLSGDIQIPAIYKDASNFSEGLAVAKIDNLIGYIDVQGNWVIPPRYNRARPFYRGYAAFRSDKKLWGLIDTSGNVVLEPIYEQLRRGAQGLTGVYVNGKWGFMDDTFHFVLEPCYDQLDLDVSYFNGLIFMQNKEINEGFAFDENGKTAFTFSTLSMVPSKIGVSEEGYYNMEIPEKILSYFLP